MLSDREQSGFKSFDIVTAFAVIQPWRTRKLPLVNVLMTILALSFGDLEKRVFVVQTLGQVTLFASHVRMLAFERVFGCRVIFYGEGGRFPTLNGMALSAFTLAGAAEELTFVRVLMAVHALREWNRRLEIPVRVAIAAGHGRVLAFQRKLRLAVVKPLQLSDLMPIHRIVAGLARLAEASLVGIDVTGGAFLKRDSRVLNIRLNLIDCWVALGAGRLFVCAG